MSSIMKQIHWFEEPKLKFAYNQEVEDPRDGLTLFGPFDKGKIDNVSLLLPFQ